LLIFFLSRLYSSNYLCNLPVSRSCSFFLILPRVSTNNLSSTLWCTAANNILTTVTSPLLSSRLPRLRTSLQHCAVAFPGSTAHLQLYPSYRILYRVKILNNVSWTQYRSFPVYTGKQVWIPRASLIKQYAMKTYGGMDLQIHILLTSALVEVSGQLTAPGVLPRRKEPLVPEAEWAP
jgi:hypothetical protein